jgi:hypothetical protein
VADGLDAKAIHAAVASARPDIIVHEMTDLKGVSDYRAFDRAFANSNCLRTEGTSHLIAGGRIAGVKGFVAQSFCGWPYARVGGPVKSEADPLDKDPSQELRRTLDAIRYLEDAVTGPSGIGGIVLRYGTFYGPDTGMLAGPMLEQVRRRRMPLIGTVGGLSCISTMPHRRPFWQSSVAGQAQSTTLWTMNLLPCASGCRGSRDCSKRIRRFMCQLGWEDTGGGASRCHDDARAGWVKRRGQARTWLATRSSLVAARICCGPAPQCQKCCMRCCNEPISASAGGVTLGFNPCSARHLKQAIANLSASGFNALCGGIDPAGVEVIEPEGRGAGFRLGHHAAAHRLAPGGKDLENPHRTHVDRFGPFPSEQFRIEIECRLAICCAGCRGRRCLGSSFEKCDSRTLGIGYDCEPADPGDIVWGAVNGSGIKLFVDIHSRPHEA